MKHHVLTFHMSRSLLYFNLFGKSDSESFCGIPDKSDKVEFELEVLFDVPTSVLFLYVLISCSNSATCCDCATFFCIN